MDTSWLKNNSTLSNAWASSTIDSFNQPDYHMDRLYHLASKNQWRLSDLDWEAIDFSGIPLTIRQSATDMFTQLHYGEITALLGSARMVEAAPTNSIRLFSTIQTADEGRHMQWFSTLINKLDCRSEVLPSIRNLMTEVYACKSIEEMVIGMHIIIEGMAHSFFMEGTQAFSKTGITKTLLGSSYQSAQKVFERWLPEFLGKDESRHLAFGVLFLQQRLRQLSIQQRDALEEKTMRWAELYIKASRDPKMLAIPGLNSRQIYNRCTKNINHHFSQIGLEARINFQ